MKKFWSNFLDVVVIIFVNIAVIVMGIWLSVIPIAKNKNYYVKRFSQNEVAINIIEERFPGADVDEVIDKVASINIDYFFGDATEYQVEINGVKLFNEYEVRHMEDVMDLFVVGQSLAVIILMLLIASIFYLGIRFKNIRYKLVITTIGFYIGVLLLILLFILWSYNTYQNDEFKDYNNFFIYAFINFHKIIFFYDYDKYLLATSQGPYNGVLWTMTRFLNSEFFMGVGITIAIAILISIILWISVIVVIYKLHPKIVKKLEENDERNKEFTIS